MDHCPVYHEKMTEKARRWGDNMHRLKERVGLSYPNCTRCLAYQSGSCDLDGTTGVNSNTVCPDFISKRVVQNRGNGNV